MNYNRNQRVCAFTSSCLVGRAPIWSPSLEGLLFLLLWVIPWVRRVPLPSTWAVPLLVELVAVQADVAVLTRC
jgi:hypothetical protein